jgi:protein arginine kinase activator
VICQNCQSQEATVVITKIVGEDHTIKHLCPECASSQGGAEGVAISIQTLPLEGASTGSCETCGKTFADFRKSGLFGCADCYSAFGDHLPKLFKRVQGVSTHVSEPVPVAQEDDRVTLEVELSEAVSSEDFERAAQLRDRLATLESDGSKTT